MEQSPGRKAIWEKILFARFDALRRAVIALFCCLAISTALSAMEIAHLPDVLEAEYDLSWKLTANSSARAALELVIEGNAAGKGYQLTITPLHITGRPIRTPAASPAIVKSLALAADKSYIFTIKRRPEALAVLLDHRLVFVAPMPDKSGNTLAFRTIPRGWTVTDARYQSISPHIFGDDFMRPEALELFFASQAEWLEDSCWRVAGYRGIDFSEKSNRGELPAVNPWQLSLLPYSDTSANGFWYLYAGIGPSWVIADPTMVHPSWDRYYFAASVRPDNRSAVGLIAAYQDNRNYLLFRWLPHTAASDQPRAILTAVIDGEPRILGSDSRGFIPGQWYRLRMNIGWHSIAVLIDDHQLFAIENPGMIEGRIGLYAENADVKERRLAMNIDSGSSFLVDAGIPDAVFQPNYQVTPYPSGVFFDDIQTGDWRNIEDITASAYCYYQQGKWKREERDLLAATAGRMIGGGPEWSRYRLNTQITLPSNGKAGILFALNKQRRGYVVLCTERAAALHKIRSGVPAKTPAAVAEIPPSTRFEVTLEVDGPYVALYRQGQRVLDYYDADWRPGRCGVMATRGVRFTPVRIEPLERGYVSQPVIHERFTRDKALQTWASSEADWAPAIPSAHISQYGAAAPSPTDQPGLYWHKGGHYHDIRVSLPVTNRVNLTGQTIHLAALQQAAEGYYLRLNSDNDRGMARLYRRDELVVERQFVINDSARLCFERRGSYLILNKQSLDSALSADAMGEESIFVYRDAEPLSVEEVGFTVTTPDIPAVALRVESDRVMDAFETAPAAWGAGNGIWGVTARYACLALWNWYGGYGPGKSVAWSKQRLLGNQSVEAYLGVMMQFPGVKEKYEEQFHDLNVSICADGENPLSGYSLVRCTRKDGTRVSQLLRNGAVVQSSASTEYLLPTGITGHQYWFATRLVKHGAVIRAFIDNRLAMSYTDPEPLAGGHIALWTQDNGIMVGRVNYSAEAMAPGVPRLGSPVDLTGKSVISITEALTNR